MANSQELKRARDRADFAIYALERVEDLPPRNGSHIAWDNGTLWTRIGDDMWAADGLPDHPYSSEHIATICDWRAISKREYERVSKRGSSCTPKERP